MFCVKCGEEIQDGAKFCPKCGSAVDVMKSELQVTNQEHKQDRKNVVTEKRMKEMGIQDHIFQDRIETTTDRKVNDYLFTLYDKLIAPVQQIEQLEVKKNEKEAYIKYLKTRHKIEVETKTWVIISIIIGVIYFFVGVTLYDANHVIPTVGLYVKLLNLSIPSVNLSYLLYILVLFLFPFGMGAMVFFGVKQIITEIIYRRNLSKVPAVEEEKARIIERQSEIIKVIAPYICFVPCDYRNSVALRRFSSSYRNTRVGNLQEAVTDCDEYIRHEEIMQSQNEICNQLQQINYSLDSLSSQMMHIDTHLSKINASVWLSEIVF